MRILFYSTSSNRYDGSLIKTAAFPAWAEQWDALAHSHAEHEFIIATQLPGMFLLDVEGNGISRRSGRIEYHIIQSDDEQAVAEELARLGPDVAAALSFYVMPYDWLPVKDAMVADFLRGLGVRTVCHSVETALICFDKWRAHCFLERAGVRCPKAVLLHHELWINAGNRRGSRGNVYRSAVLHEMRKLRFPVIVKDTTGLSSSGADVAATADEARAVLCSRRTTSDRIIEEMAAGEQFGAEIYGSAGRYTVFPPFMLSVNKYGITSPRQSVKIGAFPWDDDALSARYKLGGLKETLLRLAEGLGLDGVAQVDLVFDGEDWFVIEINPRLSGMSATYAASARRPLSELIFDGLGLGGEGGTAESVFRPAASVKFPPLDEARLRELASLPYMSFVSQIENGAARQIRERGYCEAVVTGDTAESLRENLLDLKKRFPDEAGESLLETAVMLAEKLLGAATAL